mgnify:CR=1 FL=1
MQCVHILRLTTVTLVIIYSNNLALFESVCRDKIIARARDAGGQKYSDFINENIESFKYT